jgi:serine/threonine protein kinase
MIGTSLNQYRITASIGAGGMGEVFRARDRRLNRDVAIKMLPKDFAADADRQRRFEQEAKTLAALNHPNILTIHDAGVHDGAPYLVSELLRGHTLREVLGSANPTALLLRKATDYALQIAHGLAAAHGKGVIHRDLKPENVFVTQDGRVKILDFGLAKLRSVGTRSTASQTEKIRDGVESVPTIRIEADAIINTTQPGMVLGTPAYMSPEQVRGEPADHRADIFAFGCVLYEMLSGTRAFRRDTPVASMNAVLSEEPVALRATNANIPPALESIVHHCLEKEPQRRFQTADDLAFAIESLGAISTSLQLAQAGRAPLSRLVPWAVAALCLAGFVWMTLRRGANPDGSTTIAKPILRRFELNLPTAGRPMIDGQELHPVIAPDGRKAAFANAEGLWLRRLESVGPPAQLAAGGNISSPFWSPRSAEVGFFDGTKLMRVPVEGGRPESIADVEGFSAEAGGGAAWSDDDQIYFTTGKSGLNVVPARGGPMKPVWQLRPEDGISDLHQPSPLPGAVGGLVVVHRRETNASALFGIDTLAVWKPTGEHQVIWQDPISVVGRPVYCPSGHVLFQRGFETTEIWAIPFSLKKLARTDEPFRVADFGGAPSVSADGTLLFPTMSAGTLLGPRQLVWVDHTGKLLDALGQVLPGLGGPALSRDQHRIVAGAGKGPGDFNLWLIEAAGGGALPLTRTNGFNIAPYWSAGERAVFFWRLLEPQVTHTLTLPVDGIGEEKLVLPFAAYPSPGGRYFLTEGDETNRVSASGWRYTEAGKANFAPIPLARVFGSISEPRFSPDERWLALSSPVSGRREVWVVDFPAVTNRIQVSRSGGRGPVWHRRGGELFFLTLDGKSLMSVRQKPDGGGFEEPRKVFDVPERVWTGTVFIPAYDVAADGERFLMLRRADEVVSANAAARPNAMLVENWFEEFRQKK